MSNHGPGKATSPATDGHSARNTRKCIPLTIPRLGQSDPISIHRHLGELCGEVVFASGRCFAATRSDISPIFGNWLDLSSNPRHTFFLLRKILITFRILPLHFPKGLVSRSGILVSRTRYHHDGGSCNTQDYVTENQKTVYDFPEFSRRPTRRRYLNVSTSPHYDGTGGEL